jgi:hypothetical protein
MLNMFRIAAVMAVFTSPIPALAQGIKFGTDYDAGLEKAKKDHKLVLVHFTQKGSPGCAQLIKDVFSQPAIGQYADKNFVAVKAAADEKSGAKAFQLYSVNIVPTVMILDADGQEIARDNNMTAAAFGKFLESAVDSQAGFDALAKVKKDSPAALAAALKKIAAYQSVKAKKVLREHAENENLSEGVRRVALEGLAGQKEVLGDLVPFLGKSQALKTTAFNALKAAGPEALPALLDGLDGYAADLRVNCFTLAAALTKNPKISKDANFWRTGSAEDREKALKAWKEWYEKNK